MKLNRMMIWLIIGLVTFEIMQPILRWIINPMGVDYEVRMAQTISAIRLAGMLLCLLLAVISLRTGKSNHALVLLLVGWSVCEGASIICSVINGMYIGASALAGFSSAWGLIRPVNIVLCALLATISSFARKLKSYSILPIAGCAIELLLTLLLVTMAAPCLRMLNTPEEILYIAMTGVKSAGLGMLIGLILAVIAGILLAKKRIIWHFLVIVFTAILSIVVYLGMVVVFHMGLSSMLAIGFLQPFAFLFPAFAFDGVANSTLSKMADFASAKKPAENREYSYLEAYKNKHK